MNAIMVAVEYTDLLTVTVPYNRHHFANVTIVTSFADYKNVEPIAKAYSCSLGVTDSFYADGAVFNKWRALEEGLDDMGRSGWMCIMDADVLWPKVAPLNLQIGQLCTPLRRMAPWPGPVPAECDWEKYPVHRNIAEWAGYSQIFHGSDPVLGSPPWHEQNWRHAGGADSFFQQKWHPKSKVRPTWHCLHLGEAGTNWCGRVSTLGDGTKPAKGQSRFNQLSSFISERRKKQQRGQEPFGHEKLSD